MGWPLIRRGICGQPIFRTAADHVACATGAHGAPLLATCTASTYRRSTLRHEEWSAERSRDECPDFIDSYTRSNAGPLGGEWCHWAALLLSPLRPQQVPITLHRNAYIKIANGWRPLSAKALKAGGSKLAMMAYDVLLRCMF
eukprot:4467980-Pleurochrysis_carterae.AAC.3